MSPPAGAGAAGTGNPSVVGRSAAAVAAPAAYVPVSPDAVASPVVVGSAASAVASLS